MTGCGPPPAAILALVATGLLIAAAVADSQIYDLALAVADHEHRLQTIERAVEAAR